MLFGLRIQPDGEPVIRFVRSRYVRSRFVWSCFVRSTAHGTDSDLEIRIVY